TSVTIGGVTLDASNRYYHNGDNGAVGTADSNAANASAEFDAGTGTLTLKGLNVKSNKGIQWTSYNDSTDGYDVDLTIVLEDYSDNTVVSTAGSAIVGDQGMAASGTGPSLTIKGNGALNLTGSSNGIWVWKNITIAESAAVNITAENNGICNNLTGTTTISDNAYVKINANKDGIGSDNSGTNNLKVDGGALVISAGNTAVMNKATATVANVDNYNIRGGDDASSVNEVTNISTAKCKYLRVEPADSIYADKVYIYLRTLDKDSNKAITVPDEQLEALGIKYYYSYWVDFGSYMSVKTKAYKDENGTDTTGRYDETVKAIVNETKAAAIDKKSGIKFNRLDAVTWDTLSWSQNSSGGNTWHLNGEIPLCKVKFDLNYTGADSSDASLTRYAVKGTDVNTGLPTAPTRANWTFDGWYTAADGGEEIKDIPPALKDEVTYYAQWSASTVTAYMVTVAAGEGMSTTGKASQTVTQGNAMEDVVYTADSGYYFPENYTVEPVNGISVTRNSYTQITVSGTPTMSAGITLPAATAKTKEATPQAEFIATDKDSGKLTNIENGMKFRIDDGRWIDIADEELTIDGLTACTIEVVKKGGDTTLDSDAQTITVTKAETPKLDELDIKQPIDGRDKGSIEAKAGYEISKDGGKTYEDCTEGTTSLEPGTYYIRVKATGTVLASTAQEIVIN
ncbi:MAG: InlB B-repeat-containing protein, partial [Clostridia bacterium]|nr:InlB B-repeat-containing protein [Clostridia bacterium]